MVIESLDLILKLQKLLEYNLDWLDDLVHRDSA